MTVLSEELKAMQPKLKSTQEEVADMLVKIEEDTTSANATKDVVEVQEREASKKAANCKEIKDDAQADLDKALPALEQAVKSLEKLKKTDIDEVFSFKLRFYTGCNIALAYIDPPDPTYIVFHSRSLSKRKSFNWWAE